MFLVDILQFLDKCSDMACRVKLTENR